MVHCTMRPFYVVLLAIGYVTANRPSRGRKQNLLKKQKVAGPYTRSSVVSSDEL